MDSVRMIIIAVSHGSGPGGMTSFTCALLGGHTHCHPVNVTVMWATYL